MPNLIYHFNKAIPTIQPGQRKLFGLFCVKNKTRTLILREAVRVRLVKVIYYLKNQVAQIPPLRYKSQARVLVQACLFCFCHPATGNVYPGRCLAGLPPALPPWGK